MFLYFSENGMNGKENCTFTENVEIQSGKPNTSDIRGKKQI